MTGSVSSPPSERGVVIHRRPVSRSASRTGWDRRRSRSASWLCSRKIGAISRAMSMRDVSGSQCTSLVPCVKVHSSHHAHLSFAGAMFTPVRHGLDRDSNQAVRISNTAPHRIGGSIPGGCGATRSTARSPRRARSSATMDAPDRARDAGRCERVQRAPARPAGDLALGPRRPASLARAGRDRRAAHGPQGRTAGLSPDARRPGPGGGRAGDRKVGGDLVVHRSPPPRSSTPIS